MCFGPPSQLSFAGGAKLAASSKQASQGGLFHTETKKGSFIPTAAQAKA